jgi:hypothetical protein
VNGLPLALGSLDRSPYFKYERTSWGALVIPPGRHIFDVKYSSGQGYSDIVTVEFTFKPGKAYRLYYNAERNEKRHGIIGTIQFFIEEKLQSDNEKEYLAFSGENPHYLEGVWFYSRNYPWEDITITFGGNNRFNTSSFNRRSKKTYTTEGVYFFNNDTIILYYENRQKKDFIEAQPPSVEKEILSYELTNGILRIISGGKAAIVTAGGLKGEYTK